MSSSTARNGEEDEGEECGDEPGESLAEYRFGDMPKPCGMAK